MNPELAWKCLGDVINLAKISEAEQVLVLSQCDIDTNNSQTEYGACPG